MLQAVNAAKADEKNSVPQKLSDELLVRYSAIVTTALATEPEFLPRKNGVKKGKKPKSKSRRMAERFDIERKQICAFFHDFEVPFTNNQAERDLRMTKTKQKVSGTFRSQAGAEKFFAIKTFASTAAKLGKNVKDAFIEALRGKPFYVAMPRPG